MFFESLLIAIVLVGLYLLSTGSALRNGIRQTTSNPWVPGTVYNLSTGIITPTYGLFGMQSNMPCCQPPPISYTSLTLGPYMAVLTDNNGDVTNLAFTQYPDMHYESQIANNPPITQFILKLDRTLQMTIKANMVGSTYSLCNYIIQPQVTMTGSTPGGFGGFM
jgi:hypothetical protein